MMPFVWGFGGALVIALAAINFSSNSWDVINNPPKGFSAGGWGIAAYIFAAGAVLFFGLLGVSHAVVRGEHEKFLAAEKEKAEAAANKTPEQKRDEYLVNHDRYIKHAPIEVHQADGSSKKWTVYAREEKRGPTGIVTRDVVLLSEKAEESSFTYGLMFDEYAWYKGSVTLFEGPSKKGIPIEEGMIDEQLRVGVQRAQHVVCIGLASAEISTMSEEDNEKLSDARSINLCKALFKMGYISEEHQTAVGAAGGFAKPSAAIDPTRQRTAIVIGVHYGKEFDVDTFILAINQLVTIVDLEGYSRAPANFHTSEPISPGRYFTIKDVNWVPRTSNVLVPQLSKPADAPEIKK